MHTSFLFDCHYKTLQSYSLVKEMYYKVLVTTYFLSSSTSAWFPVWIASCSGVAPSSLGKDKAIRPPGWHSRNWERLNRPNRTDRWSKDSLGLSSEKQIGKEKGKIRLSVKQCSLSRTAHPTFCPSDQHGEQTRKKKLQKQNKKGQYSHGWISLNSESKKKKKKVTL